MDFKRKYFDPVAAGGVKLKDGSVAFGTGANSYVFAEKVILALNIALATKRPLLVSGEPGSGKSTLAASIAAILDRWYYRHVVTSRTQAAELLWTFDTLKRLNDANSDVQDLLSKQCYVDPGVLWWAFNPATAEQRGSTPLAEGEQRYRAADPGISSSAKPHDQVVVLLDEIDKADPDVPNDLLDPFDRKTFTVRETNDSIHPVRDALLLLTTNGERELPPAFLRRCVTVVLDPPTEHWFVEIADRKFGVKDQALHVSVARAVKSLRDVAKSSGVRPPGTAEYLDAVEVCKELEITPDSKVWGQATQAVLWKRDEPPVLAIPAEPRP